VLSQVIREAFIVSEDWEDPGSIYYDAEAVEEQSKSYMEIWWERLESLWEGSEDDDDW
jgi:hypothetical protein